MYPPKVLIADPEEAFRDALVAALADYFQVKVCADGAQALDILRSWEPDVLIMELMLAEVDGIALLRRLEGMERIPQVMVVTYLGTEFVRCVLETLPVSYAMIKPAKLSAVVSRARELLEPAYRPGGGELGDILTKLGLRSGRQGFQDLLVGIPMLARQRNQRLGKELYDAIARENRSTARAVEKAIRDVVKEGWEKGPAESWLRLFPGAAQCPTNKEFLFRMADLLGSSRKCG